MISPPFMIERKTLFLNCCLKISHSSNVLGLLLGHFFILLVGKHQFDRDRNELPVCNVSCGCGLLEESQIWEKSHLRQFNFVPETIFIVVRWECAVKVSSWPY